MRLKMILASLAIAALVSDSQAAGPLRRLFCGRRCSAGCGQANQVQPAPNYTSVPMSQPLQTVSYQQPIAAQPVASVRQSVGKVPAFLTTVGQCVNGQCR